MKKFFRDERAATAIEYALICSLIFLAVIPWLENIGLNLKAKFEMYGILIGQGSFNFVRHSVGDKHGE